MVIEPAVTVTDRPTVVVTEFTMRSAPDPDTPTLPSITVSPSDVIIRNQPMSPSPAADVDNAGVVSSVATPVLTESNAGSAHVIVASSEPDGALFADAGCDPEYNRISAAELPESEYVASAETIDVRVAVAKRIAMKPPKRSMPPGLVGTGGIGTLG